MYRIKIKNRKLNILQDYCIVFVNNSIVNNKVLK